MKMFRLYIGTTDGPTEIQRVTPEDPEVRSVVCLDGKAIALPISDDYDAFVRRPTGIVETLTGHPAYRVDISHPIGSGYSWQLGIAIAHILARQHSLAGPQDAAQEVLWLTGEVDHNLDVGAVDDVGLKLTRAISMLKGLLADGARVTVAVPDACADEARGALAAAFPDGDRAPRLVTAHHLDDVLSAMGTPRRRKLSPVRSLARKAGRGALGGLALAATVIAAILATAAVWPPGAANESVRAEVEPSDAKARGGEPAAIVASAPPRITLIEIRAPQGRHCAAVNFNRAEPVITRHDVALREKEGQARRQWKIDPNGLCDLRHRIVNSGLGNLVIAAIAARHDDAGGQFRTRALTRSHTLDAGATFDLDSRPPPNLTKTLAQELVVVALPGGEAQARMILRRATSSLAAAESPDAWSRAIANLGNRKILIARSREIFRPGWVDTRKTGQTLP